MRNQTLYRKLRVALDAWTEIGESNNRVASMQIGVISGGVDLSDNWDEQEGYRLLCVKLTEQIISNHGRLSKLLGMQREYAYNKHGGREIVTNEIRDRGRDQEY